jgi:hypothetical protein
MVGLGDKIEGCSIDMIGVMGGIELHLLLSRVHGHAEIINSRCV